MDVRDAAVADYDVALGPVSADDDVPPGYKRTEVGVIPEDWVLKEIGDLQPFVTSGSRGWARFYSPFGSPFIRITNLSRSCIYLNLDDLRCIDLGMGISEAARTQLQHGDVLISITADIGIVGYVSPILAEPAYINQHIALVRLDSSQISAKFVSYFLAAENSQRLFRAMTDSGAKAGMNLTAVRHVPLALPPTNAEQQAIAEALSDADALIESLQQLIAKQRALKQGAMQALLTGRQRLPGFTGEWRPLSMSEKSSLKARIGWQGLTTAEYLRIGDFYLVTGTDFADGKILWPRCCFVARERYAQDRNIQLRAHDILLTKDGTIGKAAYVEDLPGPATLNSGVFVIRPLEGSYDPKFFYYVLMSGIFGDFLTKLQAGSTISHLYQKDFTDFSFLAPAGVEEQIAIAAVLSDMDAEIEALEARLAKTRALKAGMMQQLLTGRIRLV